MSKLTFRQDLQKFALFRQQCFLTSKTFKIFGY